MSRFFYIITGVLLCATLSLTACGRKGPLEAPPGAQRQGQSGQSSSGPPDRPFILDGLVR
jgi:predicted small lipoprotein YifL